MATQTEDEMTRAQRLHDDQCAEEDYREFQADCARDAEMETELDHRESVAFRSIIQPVRAPQIRATLRRIADEELKRMDGEHWAIGEMLTRACLWLDGQFYTDKESA